MSSLDNDPRIKIDGVEGVWVLMNDEGARGENGAIATQELFDRFDESFAHMFDGQVKRYGQVIAERDQWHYVIDGEAS